LAQIQQHAVATLSEGLPNDLAQEFTDLSAPPSAAPSDGELRLVQAQLVGWLNGLFQAFQVAAVERQLQLAPPSGGLPEDPPIVPTRSSGSGPYL
jgi:hypothetical protein